MWSARLDLYQWRRNKLGLKKLSRESTKHSRGEVRYAINFHNGQPNALMGHLRDTKTCRLPDLHLS